ncbi:phosphatase PAP2 family protein [Saccharomonospora sp. NPDC006951]
MTVPRIERRTPLIGSIAAGLVLLTGFAVLGFVVSPAPAHGLDAGIGEALRDQWRGPAGTVANIVSAVLGPVLPVLLAVVLAVAGTVLWRRGRSWHAGVVFRTLVLLVCCRAASFLGKPLFARERPRPFPDFSFPSGHVVSVASTVAALVVLCLWLAPHLVALTAWLGALATVGCAASRIVLDVHWLTDTLGAVLAVGGIALLSGAALRLVPVNRLGVASSA